MAYNIFQVGSDAFDRSYGLADQMRKQRAMKIAGGRYAAGDVSGAAGELAGQGYIDAARTLNADQASAEQVAYERQRQQQQDELRAQAAQTEKAYKSWGFLRDAAIGLAKEIPIPPNATPEQQQAIIQRRYETLQKMGGAFDQLGIGGEAFQKITPDMLTNEGLAAVTGQATDELKKIQHHWVKRKNDDQSTTWIDLGAYDATRQGQPQPMQGSDAGQPRNMRNNNPGNIEDGPFAKGLPGYKGSDGRFAIFDSPDAGKNAQVALLGSYGQRGFNTVSKIINRWAPPSDNNPTSQYVQFVAQKLGVSPDQPLDLNNPQVASAVADAIQQFEGGAQSASNGPVLAGDPRGDSLQGLPSVPGDAAPGRQWVPDGKGSLVNPVTGDRKPDPSAPKKSSGRLAATVINKQSDLLTDLNTASGVNARIDRALTRMDKGTLKFGPISNIESQARNLFGQSTPESRNFASFRADLEKMRNDSLRINKGVQTEGDAIRAWNELIKSINDPRVVRQRLEEIKRLNDQAIAIRTDLINQSREDSGFAPLDTSKFMAKPQLIPEDTSGLPQGRVKPMTPEMISQARAAIKAGASRGAVVQRIRQNGYDPNGI